MFPCLHTFQLIDFRFHLAPRIYPSWPRDENVRGVNAL